jgi:hypothetical protein
MEWTGPPYAETVSRVRRQLRQVLESWGLPDEVIEDAVLVTVELLANVVVHARTPFRLVVQRRGRLLHVAVQDGFVGAAPNAAAHGLSGLRLVNAIALRWGWQEHAMGKTVWAEFMT